MRRLLYILPLIFILAITGCPHPDGPQPGTDREHPIRLDISMEPTPMDVPYEVISVTETARFIPPNKVTWRAASGFFGQSVWGWDEGDKIYVCSWSGPELDLTPMEPDDPPRYLPPTEALIWNLTDNQLEELVLSTDSPFGFNPPIINRSSTYNRFNDGILSLAFMDSSRISNTRSIYIDQEPVYEFRVAGKIYIYEIDFALERNLVTYVLDIPTSYEIHRESFTPDMNRTYNWDITATNLIDHEVPMPDGSIRLVPGLAEVSLSMMGGGEVRSLSDGLDLTYGAEFTGFTSGLYFFYGTFPGERIESAYIYSPGAGLKLIPPDIDAYGISRPVLFSGYIPSFLYDMENVIFGEVVDAPGRPQRVIALMLRDIGPDITEAVKLWDTEVPDIFDIATTIRAGSDNRTVRDKTRPYIVCLDPVGKILTVFDPLLGSVRCSTPVDISDWSEGNPLPSFCANYDPDPLRPIVLVHDPGTNEIIRFDIQVREPSEGGTIVPLDK